MTLNNEQIREILEIIRNHHYAFVYSNITKDIDPQVIEKLKATGIIRAGDDLRSYFKDAYEIERLKSVLESARDKNLSYKQMKKYLFANPIPLTDTEVSSINHIEQSAGQYITKQGDLLKHGMEEMLRNANIDHKQDILGQTIKTPLQDGIRKRKTISQIVTDMRNASDDQFRDFHRVAQTELQNARNHAKIDQIYSVSKDKPEEEILVYKRPNPDACKVCKAVYLESDGVTPKVFTMADFKKNITNFGLKTKKWMPTVETVHPWSVTDGKTLIYTSEGWKQIQNVNIGDMVLTANGEFKPVVSTLKNHPNHNKVIYEIYFKYGKDTNKNPDSIKKISLTPDHKVLTDRGWVRADELKKTDKLKKVTRKCVVCKKKIDLEVRDNITCSKECMYKLPKDLSGIHGENKEEVYEKISKKVKQNWNEGVHENTLKNLKSKKTINASKERMLNGGAIKAMKAACNSISKPQKKLFKMVQKRFPSAQLEYEIFNKSLDIAIPELKIDIEYDGSYWHNKRIDYDKQRDELLEKNGWHIIRYIDDLPSQKQLNKDIIRVSQNSHKEYDFEFIEIEWIKRIYAGKNTELFDITVDGDENNFIARGIVIHNCQCEMSTLPPGFGFDKKGQITFKGLDKKPKISKPKPAEANWNLYDSKGNLIKNKVIDKIKKSKHRCDLIKALSKTNRKRFTVTEIMQTLDMIKSKKEEIIKGRKPFPIGTVRNGRKKMPNGDWVPVKNQNTSSSSKKEKTLEEKQAQAIKDLISELHAGKKQVEKKPEITMDSLNSKNAYSVDELSQNEIQGQSGRKYKVNSTGKKSKIEYSSPKGVDTNLVGIVALGKTDKEKQKFLNEQIQSCEIILNEMGVKFKTPVDFVCQSLKKTTGANAVFVPLQNYRDEIGLRNRIDIQQNQTIQKSLIHEIGHAMDFAFGEKEYLSEELQLSGNQQAKLKEAFDKLEEIAKNSPAYKRADKTTYKYLTDKTEIFARGFEVYGYSIARDLIDQGKIDESFLTLYKPDYLVGTEKVKVSLKEEKPEEYAEYEKLKEESNNALNKYNDALNARLEKMDSETIKIFNDAKKHYKKIENKRKKKWRELHQNLERYAERNDKEQIIKEVSNIMKEIISSAEFKRSQDMYENNLKKSKKSSGKK